jgi:hypothetical protein
MAEHCRRAAAMAAMLAGLGARVSYPGLPGHTGHGVLRRLLNSGYGFGGLLGVDMGSAAKAEAVSAAECVRARMLQQQHCCRAAAVPRLLHAVCGCMRAAVALACRNPPAVSHLTQLMERLQNKHGFGLMAVSLGYADTLMSLSAASTSSELSDADKAAADISDGYVRMSIGVTGERARVRAGAAARAALRQHCAACGVANTTHPLTRVPVCACRLAGAAPAAAQGGVRVCDAHQRRAAIQSEPRANQAACRAQRACVSTRVAS